MKIRWRQHEMIGIAILVLWQIILLLLMVYDHPIPELEERYSTPLRAHGIPFSIWNNVLIPQLITPLLVFAVYLLINLWVLPCFKKINGEDIERLLSKRILLAIFSFLKTWLSLRCETVSTKMKATRKRKYPGLD